MLNHVTEGTSLYDCKCAEDIDAYFNRLIQAYNSIKEHGYKSQKQLGDPKGDEIRIHITANGTPSLGSNGNHRFRIAELLDIQQIPCNVYGVNINWLVSLCKKTHLPPHQAMLNWMQNPKVTPNS